MYLLSCRHLTAICSAFATGDRSISFQLLCIFFPLASRGLAESRIPGERAGCFSRDMRAYRLGHFPVVLPFVIIGAPLFVIHT